MILYTDAHTQSYCQNFEKVVKNFPPKRSYKNVELVLTTIYLIW